MLRGVRPLRRYISPSMHLLSENAGTLRQYFQKWADMFIPDLLGIIECIKIVKE